MPALPKKPLWKRKRIRVVSVRQESFVVPVAECLGPFAVHVPPKEFHYENEYMVTHVPSGTWLSSVSTEEAAKAITLYLWREFATLFSNEDIKVLEELTPGWVKDWLAACKKRSKYLLPEKFYDKNVSHLLTSSSNKKIRE